MFNLSVCVSLSLSVCLRLSICLSYLEVGTGPLQVLDLALDFHEPLSLFVKLLQLLLLLTELLLVQLLPASKKKTKKIKNRDLCS